MRAIHVLFVISVLSVLSVQCSANITISTVPVGDPGNQGELCGTGAGGYGPDRVSGSVSYTYNIGKYEVTAGQYTDFLNKVAKTDTYALYSAGMAGTRWGSGITRSGSSGSYTYSVAAVFINRPVNYVSWGDAARFANWLHNGQPTGAQGLATTEDGAYYLNGATDLTLNAVTRKAAWTWAITSEDEWYKAAYYKGGSTSAGYWDYPTRSNTAPGHDMADASGNNANYNGYPMDPGKVTTLVGEFQNSHSPYGTFDQGGNVWEWNEALLRGEVRGLRGGSWESEGGAFGRPVNLNASIGDVGCQPMVESDTMGFRVVQAIPEPSSLMILAGGLVSLLGLRRRKA